MEEIKQKVSLYLDGELFDDDIDDSNIPKRFDSDVFRPLKQSETKEALDDLNLDVVVPNIGTSTIDQRSITTSKQNRGMTKLDVCSRIGIVSRETALLSHQAKRNLISVEGKGRKEQISMAAAIAQKQQQTGFMSKISGLFQNQQNKQEVPQ